MFIVFTQSIALNTRASQVHRYLTEARSHHPSGHNAALTCTRLDPTIPDCIRMLCQAVESARAARLLNINLPIALATNLRLDRVSKHAFNYVLRQPGLVHPSAPHVIGTLVHCQTGCRYHFHYVVDASAFGAQSEPL